MVPSAIGTDLNGVQPHLTKLQQPGEVAAWPYGTVLPFRELIAERVGNKHQSPRVAERADRVRLLTHGSGGAKQIRMRVAELEPRDLPGTEGKQHRPAR